VVLLLVGVVSVLVVVVALATRSVVSARQAEQERRLVPTGEDDLLVRTPIPVAPKDDARNRFDRWFESAVTRSGLDASPAGVFAVMFLLAAVLGGGLYMWKERLGLAALGVAVGVVVPAVVVVIAYRQYRWRLQQQLPDALRMMAGSVRAGQTLEQAIEFYAAHGTQPLAEEFAQTASLLRLGLSPAAALQSTAERVRLLDFDLLVSTVGLYMQTGGNLVLMMERLADSVRDRNQFAGQFFASTAQSRVVAITIGSVAPIILVVYALAEPEHVEAFLTSPGGWTVLGICAVMEVIGVLWLWRILKIEN
jgi:tight adherence protein B